MKNELPTMSHHFPKDKEESKTNSLGMRVMQQQAYAHRNHFRLLIKALTGSGKSRAAMFNSLYKLSTGIVDKVIVVVPQCNIGKSFQNIDLMSEGFTHNWEVTHNLIGIGTGFSKMLTNFIKNETGICLCTHTTLRNMEALNLNYDRCCVVIDEVHHSAEDDDDNYNRLRAVISQLENSKAHIIAMTATFFRSDYFKVISKKQLKQYETVTYGMDKYMASCKYLRNIQIDFHLSSKSWVDQLKQIHFNKKTIIFVPHTSSGQSGFNRYTKDPFIYDKLIAAIGNIKYKGEDGFLHVEHRGKQLKVAELITDEHAAGFQEALDNDDSCDIIISMCRAREGWDYPSIQQAYIIGNRDSLNMLVQMLGRAIRDFPGKATAYMTFIISTPVLEDDYEVKELRDKVNDLVGTLWYVVLMFQYFNPKLPDFKTSSLNKKDVKKDVEITDRVQAILKDRAPLLDLINKKLSSLNKTLDKVDQNKLIAKVITEEFPELNPEEVYQLHSALTVLVNLTTEDLLPLASKDIGPRCCMKFDINLLNDVTIFDGVCQVVANSMGLGSFKDLKFYFHQRYKNIDKAYELICDHYRKLQKSKTLAERESIIASLNSLDNKDLLKIFKDNFIYEGKIWKELV